MFNFKHIHQLQDFLQRNKRQQARARLSQLEMAITPLSSMYLPFHDQQFQTLHQAMLDAQSIVKPQDAYEQKKKSMVSYKGTSLYMTMSQYDSNRTEKIIGYWQMAYEDDDSKISQGAWKGWILHWMNVEGTHVMNTGREYYPFSSEQYEWIMQSNQKDTTKELFLRAENIRDAIITREYNQHSERLNPDDVKTRNGLSALAMAFTAINLEEEIERYHPQLCQVAQSLQKLPLIQDHMRCNEWIYGSDSKLESAIEQIRQRINTLKHICYPDETIALELP